METPTLPSALNLFPVYQPIVDRDLSVIGYEFFIRGNDAKQVLEGFTSPSLDKMNQIVSMDTLCKQLALEQYTSDAPLFLNSHPYSINPFPPTLPFPKQHDLVIEITEQAFLHDEPSLSSHVEQLVARGVRFAIDDFGSGHFSLPFILNIQPTYIKLAKEIVHLCNNEKSLDVLKRLTHPFREMGIQIIAEGIETGEQFEQMQSVADAFQGYWISLPRKMPEESAV